MSETLVYIYAMTHDTGFAPCIRNNWLTLACCIGGIKGGMRKSAANEFFAGNNIYLLGLCGGVLAKTSKMKYWPVYLAKIDKVIEMTEYYAESGQATDRKDDVYKVINGELKHKGNNLPHSESEYTQTKDIGGQYVLCSSQFTYWGDKCGESGSEIEEIYSSQFCNRTDGKKGIRDRRGFRGYIVEDNLTDFEVVLKKWDWFPQEPNCCSIISNYSISGDFMGGHGGCGE